MSKNNNNNNNAYDLFMSKATAISRGAKLTQSRGPRNEKKLVVQIMGMFPRSSNAQTAPAKGSAAGGGNGVAARASWNIVARTGSLRNNPDAYEAEHNGVCKYVRKFDADSKSKTLVKMTDPGQVIKERLIGSYETLEFSVPEDALKAAGPIQVGDIVQLYGISFSNYYSEKTDKLAVYCNVDRINRINGMGVSDFAYDVTMVCGEPVKRAVLEGNANSDTGTDGQSSQKRMLGDNVYSINVFGTDSTAGNKYMSDGDEFEIAVLDYEEKADPDDETKAIVTYRPGFFDKNIGAAPVANGFKTIATWTQHFGNDDERVILAWLKFRPDQVAPLCIASADTWKTLAPSIFPQLKFKAQVRENLEKTENETLNHMDPADEFDAAAVDSGLDFKMVASVRTMLVNVPGEIRRIGYPVPPVNVEKLLGTLVSRNSGSSTAMLSSNMHDENFHATVGRDSVILLNEWKGDLGQLIKDARHDFFIVHNMIIPDEERPRFDAEPADKRYMLFDADVRTKLRALRKPADIEAFNREHGLPDESDLKAYIGFAAAAKFVIYAVLKPEVRLKSQVDTAAFAEAVKMFCDDPEAAMKAIRDSLQASKAPLKRTAAETGLGSDDEPKSKEPRLDDEEEDM